MNLQTGRTMRNILRINQNGLICLILVFFATSASAADDAGKTDWGTLTGRFVYDGVPPKRELVELNKDLEFCGPLKPRDEELIVDAKSRGLKNVVLWLEPKSDQPPPVHPDYQKSADDQVRLDNDKCRFDPHICVLRTSQTLVIGNKDKINHQAAAFFFKNDPFNESIPPGQTVEKKLPKAEKLPAKVTCPIHAWMSAYLVVKDHPYLAVTDKDGKFELKNLPAGEWTIRVWHEEPGYIKQATVSGAEKTWDAGQATVNIKPGNNTWGDVKLSPALFKK